MKAIVTGSSKGLGFALAEALLDKGYDVSISARHKTSLDASIKKLKGKSGQVIGHQVDFSKTMEVKKYVQQVVRLFGNIDVLINNVGMYSEDKADEDIEIGLENNLNVNLMSAVRINEAIVQQMKKRKNGLIIQIISIAAKDVREDAASYSISKIALKGYTDLLRASLIKHNIKVVAIYPGPMNTSSWDEVDVNKSKLIQMVDMTSILDSVLKLSENANLDDIVINTVDDF